MAKITINPITGSYASVPAVNDRLQQIEDTLNDNVLWRDGFVAEPNAMDNDLDMNNNDIINVDWGNFIDGAGNSIQNYLDWTQEWAIKAEDSLISVPAGGDGVNDYSALHWAAKAGEQYDACVVQVTLATTQASNASTSAANAATSETNASASETAAAASETAASTSETAAIAAQAAAEAAANSMIWQDVIFADNAGSPYAVPISGSGVLYVVDTSAGAVVFNLPSIAAVTLPFNVGFKKSTGDANTVTINPDGTDEVDGGASYVVTNQEGGAVLVADTDGAPDQWSGMTFGPGTLADGSVTTVKLATQAVTTAKIAASAVTSGKIANGTIVSADIATDTIVAGNIAANAVGSSELANNAVDTAAIQDASVTAAKLAAGVGGLAFSACTVTFAAAFYNKATGIAALPFDSEALDVGGWHDNVTNNSRLTVPSGVSYVEVAGAVRTDTGDQHQGSLYIYKNGSSAYPGVGYEEMSEAIGGVVRSGIGCSTGVIAVSPGDYFDLRYDNQAGAAVDLDQNFTWFSIKAVG